MIEPTRNDLHRWVEHRLEDGTVVTGILRAIGRHHVFVAFGTENVRVACRPEDLAWFGARAENPGAAAARWRFYREGFEIVEIDSHHWLVSLRPLPNQLGSFFAAFFWPATGHWRRCGTVGSGCGPGPLIEELRARRHTPWITPDRPADLVDNSAADAGEPAHPVDKSAADADQDPPGTSQGPCA